MSHFPTIFKTRQATIEALSASGTPLTLKAFASQTANLFTVTNSSDTVMGGFTAKGQLLAYGPTNNTLNVAIGPNALNANLTATECIGIGSNALSSLTGGSGNNIAIGPGAAEDATTANSILAIGLNAAANLTTSGSNMAIGNSTMLNMTGAGTNANIAIGLSAMSGRTSSLHSTAVGLQAMDTGDCSYSVAVGNYALRNSNGINCRSVAIGWEAAETKEGGINNVFIGYRAGKNSGNIHGDYSNNIIIGYAAGDNITTGAGNNIIIGSVADLPVAGGSNQLNIGNIVYGTNINASTGLIGIHQSAPTAFFDLPASTSANASLRLRDGATVSSPNAGDIWNDGTDLIARINGISSQVSFKNVVTPYTKQHYFAETTLTDAANISWDLDDNQNTAVTLTASRTLDNPTNMKAGATYTIRFIQGGTGSYSITFGSAYVTANDSTAAYTKTLSTAVGSFTTVRFYCDGTNMIAI